MISLCNHFRFLYYPQSSFILFSITFDSKYNYSLWTSLLQSYKFLSRIIEKKNVPFGWNVYCISHDLKLLPKIGLVERHALSRLLRRVQDRTVIFTIVCRGLSITLVRGGASAGRGGELVRRLTPAHPQPLAPTHPAMNSFLARVLFRKWSRSRDRLLCPSFCKQCRTVCGAWVITPFVISQRRCAAPDGVNPRKLYDSERSDLNKCSFTFFQGENYGFHANVSGLIGAKI